MDKTTLMIKVCHGIITGENSAPLKSGCLPFVSVGSDLYSFYLLCLQSKICKTWSALAAFRELVPTLTALYLHLGFGWDTLIILKHSMFFSTCLHIRNKAFHMTVM